MTVERNKDASLLNKPPEDSLFYVLCCENSQNFIEFAQFFYYHDEKRHEILQYAEVIKDERRVDSDPIVKFKISYDNSVDELPYAISLR